jgi:hypothetical protein
MHGNDVFASIMQLEHVDRFRRICARIVIVIVIVIVIGGLKSTGLTTIIKWVRKRYLDEDIPTIRGLSTLRGTQLP